MARRPRGYVEKRGEDIYRIWIPLGKKPNGKTNYHRETFHGDEKAAYKRRDALLVQLDNGKLTTGGNIPFGAYLTRWLEDHIKLHREYTTYREYERLIEKRIKPALGNVWVSKLTPLHIQSFYGSLQKDGARQDGKPGGLSAASIRQIHAIIHGALSHAVDPLRMIMHNPADNAKLPKIDRAERRRKRLLWTEEQLQSFMEAIKGHPNEALILTLAYTGMRVSEALALSWDDVDFAGRRIHIRRSLKRAGREPIIGPVKNHQERRVPMDDALRPVLRAHRAAMAEHRLAMGGDWNPLNLVFPSETGTPRFRTNFRDRVWIPLLESLTLPYINIHGLRHTFGTILGTSGVDPSKIRDLLGHHSSSFTMDEYVTPDDDDLRDAVSVFARKVRGHAQH